MSLIKATVWKEVNIKNKVRAGKEVVANDPTLSAKPRIRAHLAPILRCACLPGQALRIYAAKSRFRLLSA